MGKQQRQGVPFWAKRNLPLQVGKEDRPPKRRRNGGAAAPRRPSTEPDVFRSWQEQAYGARRDAADWHYAPGAKPWVDSRTLLQRLLAQYHPLQQPRLVVFGVQPEDIAELAHAAERSFSLTVIGDAPTCNRVYEGISTLLREPHQVQRIHYEVGGLPCLPIADRSVDGLLCQYDETFATLAELDAVLVELHRVLAAGKREPGQPPIKLVLRARLPTQSQRKDVDTVLTAGGETYDMLLNALDLYLLRADPHASALERSIRSSTLFFTLWLTRP